MVGMHVQVDALVVGVRPLPAEGGQVPSEGLGEALVRRPDADARVRQPVALVGDPPGVEELVVSAAAAPGLDPVGHSLTPSVILGAASKTRSLAAGIDPTTRRDVGTVSRSSFRKSRARSPQV
jgi:hypothetical protein